MRRIFKYDLSSEVVMPVGAIIVLAGTQNGRHYIWSMIDDTQKETETRRFYIRGTGHPIDNRLRFVFSWQDPPFVWHLFEDMR